MISPRLFLASRSLQCRSKASLVVVNLKPSSYSLVNVPTRVVSVSACNGSKWAIHRGLTTTVCRQFSDQRRDVDGGKSSEAERDDPKPVIIDRIEATRQKTKDLTAKVTSSIGSLTPREQIYNLPNFLTATRLVAAPVIGYLVMQGDLKWATVLFAYAGITDLIDGWYARRYSLQTVVGSVIDPMADKGLMIVLTVTLAAQGLLPAYLATLILGRDIALAGAAIYYRYASLPAPKTFKRYWDFSLPSAQVHPTTLSKYNTFLQLILIGATLALPVAVAENASSNMLSNIGIERETMDQGMKYFQYLVAGTTAWSGMSYAFLKKAVTILGTNEELKAKQGRRGRAIIGVSFGSIVLAAAWLFVTRDREKLEEESLVKRGEEMEKRSR